MSVAQSRWMPYTPDESLPWTRRRVVHLHRRAALGAPPAVIARDLADTPQHAVNSLLTGGLSPGEPSQFDQIASLIGNSAVDSGNADRLKAWWVYRCLISPVPVVERLTLMWHNHFATSNLKVGDLKLMRQQNETLRQHALAPFGSILTDMLRDPALLEWLDAPSNQKGKPNENLARELLELFSLGVGHYTEQDVRETARALTGRTVREGEYAERPMAHDDDPKTCFGQTGAWKADDIIRMLVEKPATSKRLAWRLTNEFFGENVVDAAALDELAAGLRDHQLDIGWGVSTILNSRLFFSDANIATRVCDPVTYLLSPLRSLELTRDPPSTLILASWLTRMGQDLFYPPNVGGWNGGRAWLSPRTLIARTNYATALSQGQLSTTGAMIDWPNLLGLNPQPTINVVIDEVAIRLFGNTDIPAIQKIKMSIGNTTDPDSTAKAVAALLSCAAAHLN